MTTTEEFFEALLKDSDRGVSQGTRFYIERHKFRGNAYIWRAMVLDPYSPLRLKALSLYGKEFVGEKDIDFLITRLYDCDLDVRREVMRLLRWYKGYYPKGYEKALKSETDPFIRALLEYIDRGGEV
jgi:hypothetical protein